jgi:hypothetical protein
MKEKMNSLKDHHTKKKTFTEKHHHQWYQYHEHQCEEHLSTQTPKPIVTTKTKSILKEKPQQKKNQDQHI